MTELEATRIKLKCLELVEGTGLNWWEVVRWENTLSKDTFMNECVAARCLSLYPAYEFEVALGVVEGKPVWEGDILYHPIYGKVTIRHSTRSTRYLKIVGESGVELLASKFSWNPPKPKTVMVELLVEDAEALAYGCKCPITDLKRKQHGAEACRKALEGLK